MKLNRAAGVVVQNCRQWVAWGAIAALPNVLVSVNT